MRRLAIFLIVLLVLLLLAVWVVGIFFPELRWVAELTTVGAVAIVALVLLVRFASKRLKARALERELTKKAIKEEPHIAALRADMESAVRALKRERRGPGGGAAGVYGLPWFVIVGPPAVGKTTAFERSGVSFIPSPAGAPKIQGTAGTRNCDWWFSHEAILLDTAGRFATSETDHDEWMAFLDTLHRLRPERPLDGLIVAVSLPDVLSKSEGEREELASKLRDRLDEVQKRLEMVLPVYLLLTKADLVAGFVEFWSDLAKQQRAQVWGASFDLEDPKLTDPRRAIEVEFDTLVERVYARLLERIAVEREASRRTRLMQFPVELSAARAPLANFVDALCRPGFNGETLLLRGFYITSAMQVGRPVERVVSEMLRGFGFRAEPVAGNAQGAETHSYFIGDLFKKVIFGDVGLATRSAEGIERRSRRELRSALIALGIAAFVLLPAAVSYVRNAQLTHEVERTVRVLKDQGAASSPGVRGDPIESMLDTLDLLDTEATGFGIPGWFGPRAARELREPLRKAYVARIDSELRTRLTPDLEKELGGIAKAKHLENSIDTPEDRTPLRKGYETLKLCATLADPVEHVELPWAADQLARVWQRTLPAAVAVEPNRLLRHATNYLNALSADPSLKWPASGALAAARERLKELHADQLPYRWALRRAYDQPPIMASDVADAASLKYLTCPAEQELIPRQYTASAWQKIAAALDSSQPWPPEALVDRWVLADPRMPADEKAHRAAVREQYFADYTERWTSLLSKCAVSRATDFRGAKDELTALKGSKGFYKTLFAQFNANAVGEQKSPLPIPLPLSTAGCAAKFGSLPDAGALPKTLTPVQKSFEPLLVFSGDAEEAKKPAPLEKYLTFLEDLRGTLEAAEAPDGPDPRGDFAKVCHGVEGLLDGVQEPLKRKLKVLLIPPVAGTIRVTQQTRTGSTSTEWQKKVWDAWDSKLRKLSPFSGTPAKREAAAFGDFRTFFQPDGTLWGFVKGNLADSVELADSGYSSKPGAAALSGDLLSCLSTAQEISDAFFPAGDEAGLRFSMQVDWSAPDLTEAKFYIGDKATALPRAQWSSPLKWNGEGVRLEWTQGGRSTQELGRHSFSLFDLFEQLGGLKPTGAKRGVYQMEFPPLIVKVRAEGRRDPFQSGFFTRLHFPEQVSLESQPAAAVRDSDPAECPR
jgi:type VI secretion system protein ImpL